MIQTFHELLQDSSNRSRSIHVRLNHIPALASPEDTVHVLTCYYSSPLVPTLGSNVARDFHAVERDKDVRDRYAKADSTHP